MRIKSAISQDKSFSSSEIIVKTVPTDVIIAVYVRSESLQQSHETDYIDLYSV